MVDLVYINFPLIGDKRERVKNNDSDMSDTDYLSRKCNVSKRHKSSALTMPNDEFIGYGKEPVNRRSYLRKGMPSKDISSLPTKTQRKQRGEHGVLINTLHFMLYIRHKKQKAKNRGQFFI